MSKRFRYRESATIAVESLELGIERRCLYQSASAIGMDRTIVAFACLLSSVCLRASDEKQLPSLDYYVSRAHEIKPHRRTIPLQGVRPGFDPLHLTLTVSPIGEVVDTDATGDPELLKLWPQLQGKRQANHILAAEEFLC
jgi:hypothetical protein